MPNECKKATLGAPEQAICDLEREWVRLLHALEALLGERVIYTLQTRHDLLDACAAKARANQIALIVQERVD